MWRGRWLQRGILGAFSCLVGLARQKRLNGVNVYLPPQILHQALPPSTALLQFIIPFTLMTVRSYHLPTALPWGDVYTSFITQTQFAPLCNVNLFHGDLYSVFGYSFTDCIEACSTWNRCPALNVTCYGVMFDYNDSHSPGDSMGIVGWRARWMLRNWWRIEASVLNWSKDKIARLSDWFGPPSLAFRKHFSFDAVGRCTCAAARRDESRRSDNPDKEQFSFSIDLMMIHVF